MHINVSPGDQREERSRKSSASPVRHTPGSAWSIPGGLDFHLSRWETGQLHTFQIAQQPISGLSGSHKLHQLIERQRPSLFGSGGGMFGGRRHDGEGLTGPEFCF